MKSLIEEAKGLQKKIVEYRRYIHENAEDGMDLPKTVAYVKQQLTSMGCTPQDVGKGVVALIGIKTGKTLLLRADMDALPMKETSGEEFACKTGCMHACGHDFHASMLLGAAQLLKNHEKQLEGQVKLMFQPAEEILSGAKKMIEDGLLQNPKVDAAMMIHVVTGMHTPTGMVLLLKEGVITSSADWFRIDIQGKGSHGAIPHKGIDPINIGVHIYQALQNIHARELKPGIIAVISIGEFKGGSTGNVIPDTAYLQGTIRTFDEVTRNFIKERVVTITENTAKAFNATAKVSFFRGCPINKNDDKLVKEMKAICDDFYERGKFIVPMISKPATGSEDFGYIAKVVPSVTFEISAGSISDGYTYPMHNPKVRFDEDALAIGTATYANCAIEWLKMQSDN